MYISELRLQTHDLAAQCDFYSHLLDIPALSTESNELTLQIGITRLIFTQAPANERPVYHFAFNIPPQQFAEAKTWIAQRTPLTLNSAGADEFFFENWNAHALYFYDPAGNMVEFIARHTLEAPTRGPFGAQSLLNISEVGVVAEDVIEAVRQLQTQLGAPIYQGAGSDMFTPVGDERGLFIVVKRGRIWFPDTGIAAQPAPLSVTVSEGDTTTTFSGPPYQLHATESTEGTGNKE
jgi:catechol-2,3-dioxygenase